MPTSSSAGPSPSPFRSLPKKNANNTSTTNTSLRRNNLHHRSPSPSSSSSLHFSLNNNNHNNTINASCSSIIDESSTTKRVPFENLDPTFGVDEAVGEILRFETGAVVRDVVDRLTNKDPAERAKRLEALREKHSHKKKVPLRSEEEVGAYLAEMLRKGEQRRQKNLLKIAQELYPEPAPRISEKSRLLAQNYQIRQEEKKKKIQQAMLQKVGRKSSAANGHDENVSTHHHHHQEIIADRHEGNVFKPAGPIPSTPPLYLTSSPTPRVATSTPSHMMVMGPSTEQERMQRFVELSQPRQYQRSEKRQSVSVSSRRSHSGGRF